MIESQERFERLKHFEANAGMQEGIHKLNRDEWRARMFLFAQALLDDKISRPDPQDRG